MTEPLKPDDCLDRIRAHADTEKAAGMAAYHKVPRVYLGVPNPVTGALASEWRRALSVDDRVTLAAALWSSDIFEARVAAAKLLEQVRIRPDSAVWSLLCSWLPDFDSWAIADHACMAIQKRLIAEPARLDTVEAWTRSEHMWTRRAALVATLPWARMAQPGPEDAQRRERILGWAEAYVDDREWFMQKVVAWWLRDLSRRDPDRVRRFLAGPGQGLVAFARREAARHLPD